MMENFRKLKFPNYFKFALTTNYDNYEGRAL